MAAFTLVKFTTLLAVALTFVSKAVAQDAPACARNYTVQSGDWCDKISAEQHSST